MDADAAHLQKFTDVPYVIEAPASKGTMLGAAAAALARPGLRVRMDPAPGLSAERYRGMVEGIRRDLETRLRSVDGYGIDVLDISRKDTDAELARIDGSLRGGGKLVRRLAAEKGAFSAGFKVPGHGQRCLVVGLNPNMVIDRFMSSGTGRDKLPRGGLDDEAFHRMSLTHEIGHCLLGVSEAKADAFAALRMLQDPGVAKEAIATWASFREKDEWTLAMTEDDHFTAKGVWAVLERADALRADPVFRGMDLEQLAGLANAIVEERGLGPGEEEEITAVRRGLRAGVAAVDARAGLREGAMPIMGWLRKHRDVAAIGRIVDVIDNATGGARPLPAFDAQPGAFRKAVGALAANGDRMAALIARGYDAKPRTDTAAAKGVAEMHAGSALAKSIPYAFPRTAYQDRVVSYTLADGPRLPASVGAAVPVTLASDAEPDPAAPAPFR